ncbi:MAG: DnaD domain protein [Clostridiales bacterium]|nr:DnaD domain protein [Clostridiales bacterium]
MAERKSFVVYLDWKKLFKRLSREQRGDVLSAMFDYQESGQPYDGDDIAVGVAFDAMQIVFDRDDEKYQEQCQRNAENGRKGGRPRKSAPAEEAPAEPCAVQENPEEPKKPSGFSENPEEPTESHHNPLKPKKADNENDSENENDTDNDNDNENENDTASLAAASPLPAGAEAAAEQKEEFGWLVDRCRAVTGITPNAAQRETLENWCQTCGSEAVERLFDEARAHNGKTFGYLAAIMRRWEKTGVPGGQAQNRPRRGPEPRSVPTPEEAARQQAALAENQRQLEQLLADTDWMEDGRGA